MLIVSLVVHVTCCMVAERMCVAVAYPGIFFGVGFNKFS